MKSRYFKWMPVLIWMMVIFLLSSQSGNTSNENNRFIIYILSHLGLDLDNILGKWSNFMVRKAAHFSEYFILYFLIFRAFMDSVNYKKALMYAFIFTSLYACTDEFHQMFIPEEGLQLEIY